MYSEIKHTRSLDEYPYDGTFFIPNDTKGADGDLIGDESDTSDAEDTIVLETKCDIQETTKGWSAGAITASFNIYFPFDEIDGMPVRRGMMFKSEAYTMPVNGIVSGVFPTQMGGCVAYIKDVNA